MAGIAPQYQPQPQSESQLPSSAEEEALKRNTDCVYFLASPLTCKKGRECEFRHSDVARLNPTDCWYWLNGNCLNPKCGFRHPPLDGMLGTETPMSTGPSLPTPMNFSIPTSYTPNASGKQAVQCIFFQSGFCAKGDWCSFLHGPIFTNNKAPLKPGAAPSAAKPVTHEKAFSGPKKSVQEKKAPPVDINKPNKISPQAITTVVKVAPVPSRNEFSINKTIPYTTDVNKFSDHMNIPSGNPRVQKPHQFYVPKPPQVYEPEIVNNKDTEVVSREPSPGFDVLVDDEGRDSEYYPGEDQYVMAREHEKGNEYEIGRSTDKINYVDRDRYREPLGYDSHEPFNGQHAWDHKPSSERMSHASYVEKRPYPREDIHAQADDLDLRHRLVKHKKANGLRSVISQEHTGDRYISQEHTRNGYNSQERTGDAYSKDRSYRDFPKDEQHISMRESSIGSRLQGRIRLPERSFPTDRDIIRNGDRRRMSPARAIMSLHPGRVRDRRNGSVEEPSYNGRKNYGGINLRSEIMDDKFANFAGPKSLAELKNRKSSERDGPDVTDQPSLGKRKHFYQDSDNDVSFEGPKPLKEILKQKKGETIESIGNLSGKEDIIVNDRNEGLENDSTTVGFNNQLDKSVEEENNPVASKLEVEDGLIIEKVSGAYEHRDEEFEYEQVGGENLELYENEDVEEVEYYDEDEDDDDDFAKKMGVKYA